MTYWGISFCDIASYNLIWESSLQSYVVVHSSPFITEVGNIRDLYLRSRGILYFEPTVLTDIKKLKVRVKSCWNMERYPLGFSLKGIL